MNLGNYYRSFLSRLSFVLKSGVIISYFYQHHNFINLSLSSRSKTVLTYKLDRSIAQSALLSVYEFTLLQWLSLVICNFNTKEQIGYAKKQRGIVLSLFASKIFTTKEIVELSTSGNIVSRSQASSLTLWIVVWGLWKIKVYIKTIQIADSDSEGCFLIHLST